MSVATADNFFADNARYLVAALAMHVVIVVLLTVTISATRQTIAPAQLAIKATIVDNSAKRIKREKEQAEAARLERERLEAEQKEREQAEARQQEEARQEAQRAEEKRQQQLVADKKRKTEEQNKAAATKKASDDRKRAATLKSQQAEKQNAEREAREQAQREAELKRQLADEEGMMQVQNSGLLNQYVALIQQHVIRQWSRPASARPGIKCEVKVTQAPSGDVLSVEVDKCNGDAAVKESIKTAVHKASPLPLPPDARLFQRVLLFVFNPKE